MAHKESLRGSSKLLSRVNEVSEDADTKYDLEYEISPLAPLSLTASESHYHFEEPYRYVTVELAHQSRMVKSIPTSLHLGVNPKS